MLPSFWKREAEKCKIAPDWCILETSWLLPFCLCTWRTRGIVNIWSCQCACDRDIPSQRFAGLPWDERQPIYPHESVWLFWCRNTSRGKRPSHYVIHCVICLCWCGQVHACKQSSEDLRRPPSLHTDRHEERMDSDPNADRLQPAPFHRPIGDRTRWSARPTASLRCVQP